MYWHVGIDENGLGPQLGPLVVTAVLAELSPQASSLFRDNPAALLHDRLSDSKLVVNHQDARLAEAWARVLAESPHAESPEAVLSRLLLLPRSSLRASCPPQAEPQCWSCVPSTFLATAEQMTAAHRDLASLADAGVRVVWVRSAISCVQAINLAKAQGVSRLALDLHHMEDLLLSAREIASDELHAACGKVGGMRNYIPKFHRLGDLPISILEETAARSAYRVAGLGHVEFLRDAEQANPLVALASIVGKWVREALMDAIVRFYQTHDPGLPNASGYNDPVTAKFVRATFDRRTSLKIPDRCFLREQKGP